MRPGRFWNKTLRIMAGTSLAALGALLLVLLLTSPLVDSKTQKTIVGQVKSSRSFKLFTGKNNTLVREFPQSLPQVSTSKSNSKATRAEIRELLSQVKRDLEPWKDGVTLEMVERLYCVPEATDTLRIQVISGRPFVVGANPAWQSRMMTMQKQIMDLTAEFQVPDVDFILSTSDSCQDWSQQPRSRDGNFTRCPTNAPLFSFCRHLFQKSCVTMPDFSMGGWPEAFMADWRSTRLWMKSAAEMVPFDMRRSKLFWRGGDTNDQRHIMDSSPVVQESDLTDVHLMHWGSGHDDPTFREEFTSLPEHCRFKHLLHLGGISYSARLRALMLCKSAVVFPYDYDWEPKEFWYHMLKDRENIMLTGKVDGENNGENVVEVMRVLSKNKTLAEEVGRNGQHLVAEILHPDNIAMYWLELLTQYSKLMKFTPKLHADATPLEIALMRPPRGILSKERTCNVC